MSKELPNREILEKLYVTEQKSLRTIGDIYQVNKETIRDRMIKFNIPRRTWREAQLLKTEKVEKEYDFTGMSLENIKDTVEPVKYDYEKRDNTWVSLPIKYFNSGEERYPITLGIVISDTHLGHSTHLPDTYWSCISNLVHTLKILNKRFDIKKLNFVLNGDIVSGREVYKTQVLQNLLQLGHFQVFLAEEVMKKTFEKIESVLPIDDIYILRGTHETASSENYMLYLKKVLGRHSKYVGHDLVLNIAEPIGKFNILISHGKGTSDYFPVSLTCLRDVYRALLQYKKKEIPIERVCLAHTHALTTNFPTEGVIIDVTGGFQKWEKSLSQRLSGLILYVYYKGEVTAIPIRPNPEVEEEEYSDRGLEYKNMRYYSEMLTSHLQKEE